MENQKTYNHFDGGHVMIEIGYFAPQEQYAPNQLLEHAVLAEKQGFDAIWTSDHFHPWVHTNAQCGFAWIWLSAVGAKTKNVKIGPGVTAPILRYNPAIVAQAFATLGVMYPNRVFLALGTGEALNEMPVGCDWPSYEERRARLEEAIKIIRFLWSRSFVNFNGKYYRLRKANLYTKPPKPIPLYVAASGPKTAELAGKYADGIVTTPAAPDFYEVLFSAVEKGAKAAGRDPASVEKLLELMVSYDEDYERAVNACKFWAATCVPVFFKYGIFDPREIEQTGNLVGLEGLKTQWFISSDLDEHIKKIEEYFRMGFKNIHVQSTSPDEKKFIRMYGEKVLPYLKDVYKDL